MSYASPANAAIGDIVTFTYNKEGKHSYRAGVVAKVDADRFLVEDFTECREPRMFLFSRIEDFAVYTFPVVVPPPVIEKTTSVKEKKYCCGRADAVWPHQETIRFLSYAS